MEERGEPLICPFSERGGTESQRQDEIKARTRERKREMERNRERNGLWGADCNSSTGVTDLGGYIQEQQKCL